MRKINVTRKYVCGSFTNIIYVPVTGYRPFGNICPTYALTDAFNRTAQKADTPEKFKDLLNAYVKEVLSNV